jgi:hypothetical protein
MVDAADLKSASRKGVWVRVPPSAVNQPHRNSKNEDKKAVSFWHFNFLFTVAQ